KFIERKRKNPIFVYLATSTPHGPLNTPIEDARPYLEAGIPRARALYYGMIARIDRGMGRLRAKLEELDLAEDTLVIFMTDNGTTGGAGLELDGQGNRNGFTANGYNADMRGRKGTVYEGGHRAAGFLSWPGGNLAHGRDVDTLTAHFDLFPTLVEVCNLKLPGKVAFDGKSLYALLKGTESQWDERTLLVHHQGRFGERVDDGPLIKGKDYAVMTQDWRLVGKELYDMRKDPGQRIDVASENPNVVERLARRYEVWWDDVSKGWEAYAPFVVDTSKQEEYTLSAQNWHGDYIPYNQHHVRAGMKANGYWVVDVVRPGSYEIELRRWPIEVNAPMNAAVELGPYSPDKHDVDRNMLTVETMPLRFVKARLKVGDYDQTLGIDPRQTHITFNVYLEQGEQKIQSWLETEMGETWGAYYVYLRKS
ncbi:MAG: sulfatase-like hydrolase/transferase, partial [Opitutae bacterium]|nr:sulfatase-like hydrolase/transferase [Opitutae bacterium]